MASTINADTTNGVVVTSDTSGEIKLQSAGADIATVNSSGITLATGKDLTLSSTALDASASGIYLGGTASDNLLDDYEEGTWTPVFYGGTTAGTWTPNAASGGFYIKVGRLVYIYANCRGTLSGAAGRAEISGIPFARATASAATGNNATFTAICQAYWQGIAVNASPFLMNPGNFLYAHTRTSTSSSGGTVSIVNGGQNVHFAGSYYTD